MGIYEGERENPCPRCGGRVYTTFVSLGPMAYYEKCNTCGATEFTVNENALLGGNKLSEKGTADRLYEAAYGDIDYHAES